MAENKEWGKDTYILLVVVIGIILNAFIRVTNPPIDIDIHSSTGIDTVTDGDSIYIVKFKVIESYENEEEPHEHGTQY